MHAASMLASKLMKRPTNAKTKLATTDLQVRGLPVALRDKVRARAEKQGRTMSQYVIEVLRKETDHPSLEEWLDELRRLPPIPIRGGMTAAQAVREAREERAEQLARRAMGRQRFQGPGF